MSGKARIVAIRITLLLGVMAWSRVPGSAQQVFQMRRGVSLPLAQIPQDCPVIGGFKPIPVFPTFPTGLVLTPPQAQLGPAVEGIDPSLQGFTLGPIAGNTTSSSSAGQGVDLPGFNVTGVPPDPNGSPGTTSAVSGSKYIQWVNTCVSVFDTNGKVLYGPTQGKLLFTGFGGACEESNNGDPIAQFDKAAKRWVLTQFAQLETNIFPTVECLAVSQSDDALGAYNLYELKFSAFNDYPKLGVWPDAYYMSFNMFSLTTGNFLGPRACALDRSAMLAGNPATAICFQLSAGTPANPCLGVPETLLPSDLDGSTAPPNGSPNFYLNLNRCDTDAAGQARSLQLRRFHVDFGTPANSRFGPPIRIAVTPFTPPARTVVPQKGTAQRLDTLGDRLMYRVAYRNFPNANPAHESLVLNHSVSLNGTIGVRWYEIRKPAGAPVAFQQSTFQPNANFRWMGSIAMDKLGDMAVGYSTSGNGINPQINYTGRLSGDALNTLQNEAVIQLGGGSQMPTAMFPLGANRWGDYSSMSIDPEDDCTFWYTNEYLKADGNFNWSTRIAKIKFNACM
jgi:hypothetical protein